MSDEQLTDKIRLEKRAALNLVFNLVKYCGVCSKEEQEVFLKIWSKLYG